MLRDLMESGTPTSAIGIVKTAANVFWGKGTAEYFWGLWIYYWGPSLSALLTIFMCAPKGHCIRLSAPAYWMAAQETVEFYMCRVLMGDLFILHLGLSNTYVAPAVSFFHIGAMVGCVFYGCLGLKCKRRVSLLIGLIFGSVMHVVCSIWTSNVMTREVSFTERDQFGDMNGGSRKIRAFVDPNLVKGLTNELGFETTFPRDYNLGVLLLIVTGFVLSTSALTWSVVLDIWWTELDCRHASIFMGLFYWWAGPMLGCCFARLFFPLVDIPGTFLVILVHKFVVMILVLVSGETKDMDRGCVVEGSPCYLKALYYALYLWPQGSGHIHDMLVFMHHDRQHLRSATAGYVSGVKQSFFRPTARMMLACLLRLTYTPTIGAMFLMNFCVPNPLNLSLFMEWFNEWRVSEGSDLNYCFVELWPAFASQYMQMSNIPFFISACESLRNLGHFMAIARWPNMMLCGDPMNCWRSQYLYSHALFYNCGGDGSNISYVCWYLFAKSQRRQCCCPYRKLKPDAPEKCCPPCCMGPFVEETGGCPCPCCCASCST
jgi:hypothetical protein